ncbi:hypothetical protein glysoja_034170, partial [Glycine soja]
SWSPPLSGSIKCNLDAGIFKDQNAFGINGFCLRYDHGSFIKARTELHPGMPQPQEAEPFALQRARNWTQQ